MTCKLLVWNVGRVDSRAKCVHEIPPLLNHVKSLTACERNWKLKWVFNNGIGEREVMGTLRWRQQMALLCLDFEGIARTLVWPVTLFFSWLINISKVYEILGEISDLLDYASNESSSKTVVNVPRTISLKVKIGIVTWPAGIKKSWSVWFAGNISLLLQKFH